MSDRCSWRVPVAPLPHWPIGEEQFVPSAHYLRVLEVIGCRPDCPGRRFGWREVEYFSSAFCNAVDEDGYQLHDDSIHLSSAACDYWCDEPNAEHDHPVDLDLVYPYPRIHPFPFTFSRPIHVFNRSTGQSATLHVSDLHLRWSEVRAGVSDTRYAPSRYGPHGYPFNISYFRDACALFELLVPHATLDSSSMEPLLIHSESRLPVEHVPFKSIFDAVVFFHLEGAHVRDPVGRVLRSAPSLFLRQVQNYYGAWWLHGVTAVLEVRSYILDRARARARSLGPSAYHYFLDFPLSDLPYPFVVPLSFTVWY